MKNNCYQKLWRRHIRIDAELNGGIEWRKKYIMLLKNMQADHCFAQLPFNYNYLRFQYHGLDVLQ